MFHLWSFAAGLIHIPVYSFPWSVPLLLLAALCCLMLAKRGISLAAVVACGLLGMALGSWNLQRLCDTQLSPQFEQTLQSIRFTVVSIPAKTPESQIFIARVDGVACVRDACAAELRNRLLRVSWYRSVHDIQPGQIWRGDVKVRRPRGFVNPQGFDYHAWLLGQGVVASGSVRQAENVGERWVWAAFRSRFAESVLQLADSPFRRFWRALLIGEKSEITQSDWERLQATGTVHLLVISGLHIGLAATWGYWLGILLGRLFSCCQRGSNGLVMQILPPLMACAWAGFYAALAGFSIPTMRALTACLALMLCRIFGLQLAPFTLLGIAVVTVGINEPLAWQNAGFWLSFLAVTLLFYAFAGRPRQTSLRIFLFTQPMLAIGLTLPLWLVGQGASLVGPLANFIAVPLVSLVLVPTLLFTALTSGISNTLVPWVFQALDQVFGWLWLGLGVLQDLPVPLWWPMRAFSTYDLAIAGLGVLLLLAPGGLAVRGLGALWLTVALLSGERDDYQLRVTVMDVGQGQAVVLQTPGQTWLYDAGPAYSDRFDAGSRILTPYLRQMGIQQVGLIVSHADLDHAGGVQGVLTSFDVQHLLVGEPLDSVPQPGELCRQGQQWQADSVTFTILWPPDDRYTGNNSSCVLLVEFASGGRRVRLLLPGDVDRSVERELLKVLAEPVDWILAPHHGSNSSSSYRLLYRAQPQHVVFSAGYQNRYGHPHPKVQKRYQEMTAEPYSTATDGALVFTWADEGMAVIKTRESEARLWHRIPVGEPEPLP